MLLNSAKSTQKSRIKKGKKGCICKIQDLFGTCAIPRQKESQDDLNAILKAIIRPSHDVLCAT
jgi:hypothetical protein